MAKVYVDVFPWLKACLLESGNIPINGIFRHAKALSRVFTPAVLVQSAQDQKISECVSKRLDEYLGKRTTILTAKPESGSVWLSLGVDQWNPNDSLLRFDNTILKATIIQDTLGLDGYYGAENVLTYKMGAEANNVFLAGSETSKKRFLLSYPGKTVIPYSSFHSVPCDVPRRTRMYQALTVHPDIPYKNFERERAIISNMLGMVHVHLGRLNPEHQPKERDETFRYLPGPVTDPYLWDLYTASSHFVCASCNEGFSIPPLEAIILGVPNVWLSDIPVHREIYGKFKVVSFFDPFRVFDPMRDPFRLRPSWGTLTAQDAFTQFTFERAVKPFQDYLVTNDAAVSALNRIKQ